MARPAGKNPQIRQQILDAATALFAARGGADTVSLDEIVAASGIARATVYGHFGSKAALAAAAARQQLAGLIEAAPSTAKAGELPRALERFAARTRRWLEQHPAEAAAFFAHIQARADYSGEPDEAPSLRLSLRALFDAAAQAGDLRDGLEPQFLADGYALLWFAACAQWLAHRDGRRLADSLAQLNRLCTP